MDEKQAIAPGWVEPFLAALRDGSGAAAASRIAGISGSLAYHRRRKDPAFAAAWDAIKPVDARERRHAGQRRPRGAAKLDRFLDELAATSNVSAAAAVAGVSASAIYQLRRESPEFARRWYAALAEGYDNLEMELLGHLRSVEDGGEAAKSGKKFDTAAALRCLAAHRESVAREKGRRALAEEVVTIESINAKIDRLRLASEEGQEAIAEARKAKKLEKRRASNALPVSSKLEKKEPPSSSRSTGEAGTSEAAGRTKNGA